LQCRATTRAKPEKKRSKKGRQRSPPYKWYSNDVVDAFRSCTAIDFTHVQVLDAKHTISAEKVTAAEHRADHMARIGTLEATIQMLREQLEQQRKSYESTLASTKEDSYALQQNLTQQLEASRRAFDVCQDEANLRAADLVAEIQHLKTINQELRVANSAFHEALTAAENEFASVADAVADFGSRDSPSRTRRQVPMHPSMRSIKARDAGFLAAAETRRDSSMSDSTASMHEPISTELRSHLNRV
jgi:type II secretory pathway component GspD/PulD (secretin)